VTEKQMKKRFVYALHVSRDLVGVYANVFIAMTVAKDRFRVGKWLYLKTGEAVVLENEEFPGFAGGGCRITRVVIEGDTVEVER
jgi:hypothetical protein